MNGKKDVIGADEVVLAIVPLAIYIKNMSTHIRVIGILHVLTFILDLFAQKE